MIARRSNIATVGYLPARPLSELGGKSEKQLSALEHRKGRICQGDGCNTKLSVFNPDAVCSTCKRKSPPTKKDFAVSTK